MAFNLFEVVKYEDEEDGSVFAWRHPNRELKPGTTVIVQFNQQAVFVKSGRVAQTLGPGKHRVDGGNAQFLTGLTKKVTGGVSPHSGQLWFVNTLDMLNLPWGVPHPITVEDPKHGVLLEVRAHGEFGARVVDFGPLLTRVMGQKERITVEDVKKWTREKTLAQVQSAIATVFGQLDVDLGQVSMHLETISVQLNQALEGRLREYGIELFDFSVQMIKVDQESQAYRDIYAAQSKVLDSNAQATKRRIEGYSYQEERKFDVLEGAAKNEGRANPGLDLGLGLSMGMGVGNAVGDMLAQSMRPTDGEQPAAAPPQARDSQPDAAYCIECGTSIPTNAKFCPSCGTPQTPGEPRA